MTKGQLLLSAAFCLGLLATGAAEAKVKLPAASTDPNVASAAPKSVKVGYLGLTNDPRNAPNLTYTNIQLAPPDDPVTGAQMGIADEAIVSKGNGFALSLDVQKAADLADLVGKVNAMASGGERFIIADLPDDMMDQVAAQTKSLAGDVDQRFGPWRLPA